MHSFQTLKSASLQFFWFISSSGPEGFDQEAAAVLMARYAVFKCENEETEDLKWSIFCHRMIGGLEVWSIGLGLKDPLDVLRWVDRMLIRCLVDMGRGTLHFRAQLFRLGGCESDDAWRRATKSQIVFLSQTCEVCTCSYAFQHTPLKGWDPSAHIVQYSKLLIPFKGASMAKLT